MEIKNINPADPHTSISHILMSHEQLPSCSIPTFHCHYCSKNFGRIELGKESSNNLDASFLDVDIKIKDGQFQVGLFDKRDAFPFTIVRMPYKSSNIPSNIFYSSICAETLRVARVSNNSNYISSSTKPLVIGMLKQGAYKERLSNTLCNYFNKHQNYFQYVAKTAQELLALIFKTITKSSYSGHSMPSIAIAMQISGNALYSVHKNI